MTVKPKPTSSLAEQELNKAEANFQAFDQNIKEMTLDRLNEAPKKELEPQTKIAQVDIDKRKDIYLKPIKQISGGPKDKFNEKFRSEYEFQKEYVQFIAENKEIIGEEIDIWTRPFGGMPAEEWKVPTNKPVWGPRYLAEQINRKGYHRFIMSGDTTGGDNAAKYYGQMAVDTLIPRLTASPVSSRKSIFMGAGSF